MASLTSVILLLLSAFSTAVAFSVTLPLTVEADNAFSIHIDNDIATGANSIDRQFDSFRLILAIQPPTHTAPTNACYLGEPHLIFESNLNISIPASVGASGKSYRISAIPFNREDDYCHQRHPQQDNPSQTFNLNGGSGQWSKFELTATFMVFQLPNYLPSTAYQCARNCNQKFWPENVDDKTHDAWQPSYECIAKCPGVDLPIWDAFNCLSTSPTSTIIVNTTAGPTVTGIIIMFPLSTPAPTSLHNTPDAASTPVLATARVPSHAVGNGGMALKNTFERPFTQVLALGLGMLGMNI